MHGLPSLLEIFLAIAWHTGWLWLPLLVLWTWATRGCRWYWRALGALVVALVGMFAGVVLLSALSPY
jgi:hypothetical protein